MPSSSNRELLVKTKEIPNGFQIELEGQRFPVEYAGKIWEKTPKGLRQALVENLAFGDTHFLPLMLDKDKLSYDTPLPLLESFLFRNQLYDMTNSEMADGAKPLSYLRKFYNLDYEFKRGDSALPNAGEWPKPDPKHPVAVLPFTFGKESLATVALCLELGIKPILIYCQEPVQPHEEAYKVEKLKEFGKKFNVETHFIKNAPGLFRYGVAFKKKEITEIGWGAQTTLLALLSLPFVYAYNAQYILMGNEISNNEFEFKDGWKMYSSGFDQTSFWTRQQNNMIRILTGGNTSVKSSLEPLEEINIFYLLHHRYPEMGKHQFSCSGEKPLYEGSQWCHQCYKCVRMFLFARACGIDPYSIGFKKDLLQDPNLFSHYFGTEYKTGSAQELDFAFYALYKKKIPTPLLKLFERDKLPHLKPWDWFRDCYTTIKTENNLPDPYRAKMMTLFTEELNHFGTSLPA